MNKTTNTAVALNLKQCFRRSPYRRCWCKPDYWWYWIQKSM